MSDRDPCSEQLSRVLVAFNRKGSVEPGLDVDGDDDALVQLRKACRVLDGVRTLRDIDSHYTLIVEGSFAAVERTVQFYLVEIGKAAADEITNHSATFRLGAEAGVFSDDMASEITDIWQNYRNGTYYQQDRATAEQAEAMFQFATRLHDHVSHLAGRSHDCWC